MSIKQAPPSVHLLYYEKNAALIKAETRGALRLWLRVHKAALFSKFSVAPLDYSPSKGYLILLRRTEIPRQHADPIQTLLQRAGLLPIPTASVERPLPLAMATVIKIDEEN